MADKVINIYQNHIFPISGYNKTIYSDNGSHFINQKIQNYFQKQELTEVQLMDIREKVVFANSKSQKIYSYIPTKLILGFSS